MATSFLSDFNLSASRLSPKRSSPALTRKFSTSGILLPPSPSSERDIFFGNGPSTPPDPNAPRVSFAPLPKVKSKGKKNRPRRLSVASRNSLLREQTQTAGITRPSSSPSTPTSPSPNGQYVDRQSVAIPIHRVEISSEDPKKVQASCRNPTQKLAEGPPSTADITAKIRGWVLGKGKPKLVNGAAKVLRRRESTGGFLGYEDGKQPLEDGGSDGGPSGDIEILVTANPSILDDLDGFSAFQITVENDEGGEDGQDEEEETLLADGNAESQAVDTEGPNTNLEEVSPPSINLPTISLGDAPSDPVPDPPASSAPTPSFPQTSHS